MPVTQDMLVTELQNLLRLTAFEQTIATVRRTQARTAALEQELTANVQKARERSVLLVQAIRDAGGVPDVVGSALGKVGAFTTAQLNQVQTLQGALLGDLTLEHQLRERTRYARTLAQSLEATTVLPVLDRLETAHTATIDWLEARLTEVGRTGTSLLRATPLQAVVGTARRLAFGPLTVAAGTVNQVSALLRRAPAQVKDSVGAGVQGLVGEARDTVAPVLGTVRDAAAQVAGTATQVVGTASQIASEVAATTVDTASDVAGTAADTVSGAVSDTVETVSDAADGAALTVADLAEEAKEHAAELTEVVDLTGTGDVSHPFAGYERLSGDRVMGHIRDTKDVAELTQLLAFEAAHKARKGVLAAAEERLAALTVDA